MPKFKKKPEIIDAAEWRGYNLFEVYIFVYGKDPLGNFSICKASMFAQNYDKVKKVKYFV